MPVSSGDKIQVTWKPRIKKMYTELGYEFTNHGDVFEVDLKDLPVNSTEEIEVYCNCDESVKYRVKFSVYYKQLLKNGDYLCKRCLLNAKVDYNRIVYSGRLDELDELFLKNYVEGMNLKDLADIMSISIPSTIRIKNYHLPIDNLWSEEDVRILREKYNTMDLTKLSELLNKPNGMINAKAVLLRLNDNNGLWLKWELDILHEYYGKISTSEIKSKLKNRSIDSITSKAEKLNLKSRHSWEVDEDDLIKRHYADYTNKEIQELLPGRTISAIKSRADTLGLYKSKSGYRKRLHDKKREELLEILIDLSKKLGRTPQHDDFNGVDGMPGMMTYFRYFDSYSKACELVGLVPNHTIYGKSVKAKSKNGDNCLSKTEVIISDLLFDNDIHYKKEIPYKEIINGYDDKNIRCDWLIDDIIVEYFGLPEKEHYQKRIKEKVEICEKFDQKLIELYPEDLKSNLSGVLKKFKKHNINLKYKN